MKTQLKTIKVNFEVKKDGEAQMHQFCLPVSKERHAELTAGLHPDNKVWHEVKDALENLARLQKGSLGGWGIELQILQEGY